MVNTHVIMLNIDGEEKEVALRLTIKGQFALKKLYPKDNNALTTILTAIDDSEKAVAIFTEALNFKNNDNPILSGADLYDTLVDNGFAGTGDFASLLLGIARASGLVTQKQLEKLEYDILKRVNDAYDDALEDEEKPEKN